MNEDNRFDFLDKFGDPLKYPYYDRSGRLISMKDWVQLADKDHDFKRVALTHLCNSTIQISTVALGMNHNWGDGPPLVCETMVFCDTEDQHWTEFKDQMDSFCTRSSNEWQGLLHHYTMILNVLNKLTELGLQDYLEDDIPNFFRIVKAMVENQPNLLDDI